MLECLKKQNNRDEGEQQKEQKKQLHDPQQTRLYCGPCHEHMGAPNIFCYLYLHNGPTCYCLILIHRLLRNSWLATRCYFPNSIPCILWADEPQFLGWLDSTKQMNNSKLTTKSIKPKTWYVVKMELQHMFGPTHGVFFRCHGRCLQRSHTPGLPKRCRAGAFSRPCDWLLETIWLNIWMFPKITSLR